MGKFHFLYTTYIRKCRHNSSLWTPLVWLGLCTESTIQIHRVAGKQVKFYEALIKIRRVLTLKNINYYSSVPPTAYTAYTPDQLQNFSHVIIRVMVGTMESHFVVM